MDRGRRRRRLNLQMECHVFFFVLAQTLVVVFALRGDVFYRFTREPARPRFYSLSLSHFYTGGCLRKVKGTRLLDCTGDFSMEKFRERREGNGDCLG